MKYVVGIDCGGTKTIAQAYSLDGKLLETFETGFGNVTVDYQKGINHITECIHNIYTILGKEKCAGDRDNYRLFIPDGFKLVFSLTWTLSRDNKNKFLLRRMSFSSSRKDPNGDPRYPNIQALTEISKLLGFPSLEECMVDIHENVDIPNIEIVKVMEVQELSQEEIEKFSYVNK